jgi:hypothetical protein
MVKLVAAGFSSATSGMANNAATANVANERMEWFPVA